MLRRTITVYNLEMVLAVGYRVTTPRAVQLRQWATTVLREYLVRGFALQDERLKDPAAVDYFDELLERITGKTAAEFIVARADPHADNMGLTGWSGPKVRKRDAGISKNYLSAAEVSDLSLLRMRFLDFAEDRARRRQQITIAEWVSQTDRFLGLSPWRL